MAFIALQNGRVFESLGASMVIPLGIIPRQSSGERNISSKNCRAVGLPDPATGLRVESIGSAVVPVVHEPIVRWDVVIRTEHFNA